jgi:hypothetical protein
MKKCKVCGAKTKVVFNINFKATPICEGCATSIFLQQAKWYADCYHSETCKITKDEDKKSL